MMKFEHEGAEYAIEFKRDFKRVKVHDKFMHNVVSMKHSTYPYTTVYLVLVDKDLPMKNWEIKFSATVGCSLEDVFSYEEGRKAALRKLTPTIPAEMRPKVWNTYLHRADVVPNPPKPKGEIAVDVETPETSIMDVVREAFDTLINGED